MSCRFKLVNPAYSVIPDAGGLYTTDTIEGALQEAGTQLAQIETEPEFKSTSASESATLGSELVDNTGWTSAGWTGDFATGFTHTPGNTSALSRAIPSTGTKMYQIELTVESATASTAFTVSIGNSVPFVMYEGDYVVPHVYSRGIQSISDGDFIITPESAFDGKITGISIKEITNPTTASVSITDSTTAVSVEIRPTTAAKQNIFIGKDSGKFNTTGHENVAIGYNNMPKNLSGFWNTVVGKDCMSANTSGSRNSALGYLALNANISGHRNVAIGSFALLRNTHGANNIALGADALWYNTTGNYNIGLGLASLAENTTGSYNIALGVASLAKNASGIRNLAVGDHALATSATGDDNIAIGYQSLYTANGASKNIAIGYNAMQKTTTGSGNICIGENAKNQNTTGLNSIAIGYYAMNNGNESYSIAIGSQALYNASTVNGGNIAIGESASRNVSTGEGNVSLGYMALNKNTTGKQNVAIGHNAGLGSATGQMERNVLIGYNVGSSLAGGGDYNVVIGASSGSEITTGKTNVILGYNCQLPSATSSNCLNIGNTIYGDLATDHIGIGIESMTAVMHLKAGTATAGTASLKIDQGVLLSTAEAGAIEFDGTNLYFTDSTNTRRTLAVV